VKALGHNLIQEYPMRSNKQESAILIGVQRRGVPIWEVNDNIDELEQLAITAGATIEARVIQDRGKPSPATFIGKGKVGEVRDYIYHTDANLVIFDDDLSPAQGRNLEKMLGCKIIDRSGLILDIFAQRANTMEARIQVELAQLQYLRPRLTRAWGHLGRQEGGIGMRGPGETQLEVDRRVITRRMTKLKKSLKKIEKSRITRRSGRRNIFKVGLIGYTNAGKSTILNALTKSEVLVENKLFATLDPTVRSLRLPEGRKVLLIDTVGFIRKLPVGLLASFRSTLEESKTADLFLNVIDLSHPHWEGQLSRTEEIIKELELDKKPQVLLFNKVDKVDDQTLLEGLTNQFPEAIFLSALRGIRLWDVLTKIEEFATREWVRGSRSFYPDQDEDLKDFESQVKVIGRLFKDGKIVVDYLV
jgi:GTP-binding protein HflX